MPSFFPFGAYMNIRYQQLDAWAKYPDFQARVRDSIIVRQALDRIMIGWNGEKVAADTDLATNPLLQDVNRLLNVSATCSRSTGRTCPMRGFRFTRARRSTAAACAC